MKKYDLIVPLGSFCATARFLQKKGLRKQSLPFDWIKPIPINQAIDFIENGFTDFLNPEDLEQLPVADGKNFNVLNIRTGVYFVHDFPKELTVSDYFPTVKAKYDRRIKRLYDSIATSKDILFLHIHNPPQDGVPCDETITNDENISKASERLQVLFENKNITLLFIRLSCDENQTGYKLGICNSHYSIYDYFYDFSVPQDFFSPSSHFYRNIQLIFDSFFCFNRIDKYLISIRRHLKIPTKILCWFIPSKALRKRIRRLYLPY